MALTPTPLLERGALQRRGGRAWVGLVLLLAAVCTACTGLPKHVDTPPPLAAAAARAQVSIVGAQGEVSDAAKARDLARLRAEGRAALVERQLGVFAAQGEVNLYRGNSARLLIDGPQTLAAMKAAIAAARGRLLLQFYIVEDDGVAAEIAELLLRKAAAGVSVALLYDSLGSMSTPREFFERLKAGGIAVCAFNPVNPLERPGYWGLVHRNHRKLLVADSELAYTGGINLSNVYAEGSFGSGRRQRTPRAGDDKSGGWRDTQVELRGPVVAAMAAVFRETWQTQGCPGVLPAPPPPSSAAPGQRVVRLMAGTPREGLNPSFTALLGAIGAAQHSVSLTMAYFAPGQAMVRALSDAARRGVDVRLVLPGRSDVPLVLHAARSYYEQMLAAGVRIYEMPHTVLHAKTAVVDGVYASVGSSNLDGRSIDGNDELDVIVLGEDFGAALDEVFAQDVTRSTAIDARAWQGRSWRQKVLERLARSIERWL